MTLNCLIVNPLYYFQMAFNPYRFLVAQLEDAETGNDLLAVIDSFLEEDND